MCDVMERGQTEFLRGNFQSAAELFSTVIDKAGDTDEGLEALKKRSTCHQENGTFKKALDDANRVLELDPKSTSGYALKGRALTKLHKFEDALETFKKGLDIDNNDLEISNGLKDMQADILNHFEKQSDSTYDAVTMSSQEPYPGDNELEVLEREIMGKWGINEFPPIDLIRPDPKMALKEYERAINFKKAGNDNQALDKLRLSLRYDPANFGLRAELATLLYEMGELKEAYQQCQCIPFDFRQAKHWKTGGKILNALQLPVHAESWLRQGCKLDKSDREMAVLFQNIRVKRLYGPLTQNTHVNVVFTQYGRAIQASESMKIGEDCFRDKPVILAQTLDTLNVAACSHCAKCLMRPEDYFGKEVLAQHGDLRKLVHRYWPIRPRIECKECGSKTIFCSTECRDEAWASYHQVLCCSVNSAVEKLHEICLQYKNLSHDSKCWKGVWNASFSPFVLAKMWASVICLANTMAAQEGRNKPSPQDWTLAKSPLRKFIAYGATSVMTVIPKMVDLMQEIFNNDELPENLRYTISNKEFDGRYFQATCNVQAFSDPLPPFQVFMKNVQCDPRGELVRSYTREDPDDALFAGMFALHACLNHSCANNVEVLDGHPGVVVRARLPIKAGEELYTTYINTRLPRKERRAWLYRGYNFWCQCMRCKFEGDGPEKCTECGKDAKTDDKIKYPGCGKCQKAWYCSTDCQRTAWKKGHKKICSKSA